MVEKRPIVLVTGANGGVGFGVCHRLLIQLAQNSPTDASPKVQKSPITSGSPDLSPYLPATGATLILGCRSQKRAEAARAELLQLLDNEVVRQKSKGLDARHAETLQKNLEIAIVNLDLSSVENVFACAADIRKRFPYITHMVFNAGVGSFTGINWPLAVYEICTRFKTAMTAPGFKIQAKGQMSEDGLGWVWQCNIFGHYILARTLRDMLARNPYNDARVMWMSSLEGRPSFFPGLDDWQLVKASHSYEASKYETELLACTLDQVEAQNGDPIRHLVVHPGIVGTNIFIEHTGWLLDKLMFVAFYLARWLGSPHHVIQPYKAAISAVHIALVSLAILPSLPRSANTKEQSGQPPSGTTDSSKTRESDYQPVHYGAEANFFGTEYVGVQPVEEWEEQKDVGRELLARCDRLYEGFENKMQL